MEGDPQSMIEAGLAAIRRGDAAAAVASLRQALDRVPPPAFPWSALANAEIAQRNYPAAAEILDRGLIHSPHDPASLLLRGWLFEQAAEPRAAVSFYQLGCQQAATDPTAASRLKQLVDHATRYCAVAATQFDARLREAVSGELSPALQEALGLLRGEREVDLQQPTVFYYPGLPQRRFYEPSEFPWMAPMIAAIPDMAKELRGVAEDGHAGFSPYVERKPNRPAPTNPLLENGAWTAFYFWKNGEIVSENAARCPMTMAALQHAPMPRMAKRSPNAHWSRLLPGAHIAPHTGMLNTRLICHIPIKTAPACTLRVGSETRTWEEGVPLIFDDSIEHEARNAGPEERVVLLFEIWRPEIPEADRSVIDRMFEAIGQSGL